MAFLDDATRAQVEGVLAPLDRDVELVVYTASNLVVPGQDEPGEQRAALELLREVAATNPRISVTEKPLAGDDTARAAGIRLAPTIVLREAGSDRTNIRFVGLPSGYEFQTLIEAILLVGTGESGLSEASVERLAEVDTPVTLRSFVTPTCPYCPRAVVTGYRFAYHNPNIVAEGIEATEFPLLSQQHRISSVPDTIIEGSGRERVLGGQPERVFMEAVRRAAGLDVAAD